MTTRAPQVSVHYAPGDSVVLPPERLAERWPPESVEKLREAFKTATFAKPVRLLIDEFDGERRWVLVVPA